MEDEGITFVTGVEVGKDKKGSEIMESNDAMLLCLGATWPRDLPIPGMIVLIVYVVNCYTSYLTSKNKHRTGAYNN